MLCDQLGVPFDVIPAEQHREGRVLRGLRLLGRDLPVCVPAHAVPMDALGLLETEPDALQPPEHLPKHPNLLWSLALVLLVLPQWKFQLVRTFALRVGRC